MIQSSSSSSRRRQHNNNPSSCVVLQPFKSPPAVCRGAVYERVMKILQRTLHHKLSNSSPFRTTNNISSSHYHHYSEQTAVSSTMTTLSSNSSSNRSLSSTSYSFLESDRTDRQDRQTEMEEFVYDNVGWSGNEEQLVLRHDWGDHMENVLFVMLYDLPYSTKQSTALGVSSIVSLQPPTLNNHILFKGVIDTVKLKSFLNHSSLKTITCYDLHSLLNILYTQHGIQCSDMWSFFDIKVAAHLLQPDSPASSSLTDLSSGYTQLPRSSSQTLLVQPLHTDKTNSIIRHELSRLCEMRMSLQDKLRENKLWELFTNLEMRVVPIIAGMEWFGVQVNTVQLITYLDNIKAVMKSLEVKAHQSVGHSFSLTSTVQLREVLFTELKLHLKCSQSLQQTSVHKVTSTAEPVLQQLSPYHPLPDIILQYRQCLKLKGFIDSLLFHADSDGCLRSKWHTDRTSTGRMACSSPNMQAFPKQPHNFEIPGILNATQVSIDMRSTVVSRPGTTFVTLDFKSIELRLLAHYSQDSSLYSVLSVHDSSLDVFLLLTSQWFGMTPENVSPQDRERTKRVVYAISYGVGKEKLAEMIQSSTQKAQELVKSFLKTFPMVQKFIQDTIAFCRTNKFCVTLCGRKRWFPSITSSDYQSRTSSERQAVNFVIQGTAADICKIAMIKINDILSSHSPSSRLLLQIHDELLYEVPDGEVPLVSDKLREMTESPLLLEGYGPLLKVPLAVKITTGKQWS